MGIVFNEIKAHVKRNKTSYIVGGTVVIAGITWYITRSTTVHRRVSVGLNAHRGLANTASINLSGKNHNLNNVTLIASNRQGPPSWVVWCKETKEGFLSQRAAAMANNINQSDLSQHLNGLHEHVKGLHFERLCLAG